MGGLRTRRAGRSRVEAEAAGFCVQRPGPHGAGPVLRQRRPSSASNSAGPLTAGPKTQVPTAQIPTLQVPTLQVPTLRVHTLQVPTLQVPTLRVHTLQGPTVWGPALWGPAVWGLALVRVQTVHIVPTLNYSLVSEVEHIAGKTKGVV